jgi:hypothetical protein
VSDANETKVCPLCAETIKAAAKICPFCRSRQIRFLLSAQEFIIGAGGLVLLGMAVWVLVWLAPIERGIGGRKFAGHRDDLIVIGAELNQPTNDRNFWLSGYVTNRGKHPWRIHELEVRFVDRQNTLVDVRHPLIKDPFIVLPGQDHGVRVNVGELAFTNRETALQARVQNATDGDRPYKSGDEL